MFRKEWGCDFAANRLGMLRRGGLVRGSIAWGAARATAVVAASA